jgi:hypothetical protein
MAVMMMTELPGVSPEMYDEVNKRMGVNPDALPEGLISHVAGPTDGGMLVVDVWESPEAFERFVNERLGPVLADLGAPAGPEPALLPVHNHIRQGSGTDAGVIVVIESDGFTPDDYDRVTAEMPAHVADGSSHPAVSHIAAVSGEGMVFVDVWDSPESVSGFFEEQLAPATAATGTDLGSSEPRFVPVHNRFAAQG